MWIQWRCLEPWNTMEYHGIPFKMCGLTGMEPETRGKTGDSTTKQTELVIVHWHSWEMFRTLLPGALGVTWTNTSRVALGDFPMFRGCLVVGWWMVVIWAMVVSICQNAEPRGYLAFPNEVIVGGVWFSFWKTDQLGLVTSFTSCKARICMGI